jgi:OOP family OmpA-OmpF porin
MSNFVKATIAVIILLLLWGGTLYFRRGPIEQDLTTHVKAALSRAEFSNVAISFNGREGTLTGSVASQDLKAEAEEQASEYWGVRTIDNQLEVAAARAPEAPAPQLAVLSGFQLGDRFLLTGTVPDQSTRSRLVQQAEAVFGSGNVTDLLRIHGDLRMAEGFDADYDRFLRAERTGAVGFAIENNVFTLKNTVPDELSRYRPAEESASKVSSGQQKIGVKVAAVDTEKKAASVDLQRQLDELLQMNAVEFAVASAVLDEASKKILDRVAELLNAFPQSRVEIQGHTDNTGQSMKNLQLSDARAQAVYRYLTEKGIAADRLPVNGYGDRRPIADNSTAEGRQHNRRVAFRLQQTNW